MSRTQLVWILLGLITLLSGCRMGAHPFDYCGPTYTCGPGGCSLCEPRAGSILSGPGQMGPPPVVTQPAVVQPAGTIDFGPDILSASEDNLGGPPMDAPAVPDEGTVVEGPPNGEEGTVVQGPEIVTPAPESATPPKAAESTGWTAVRHHEPAPPATGNP
jgi:hypothetical protein